MLDYWETICGFNHLEKYEFVNGKDDIHYTMEFKNHVPHHQPAIGGIYNWDITGINWDNITGGRMGRSREVIR